MIIFSFLYSGKNWKYAIYAILSMVLNIIVQYICYLYKIRFIDFTSISDATKIILSLDYFIIMIVIILVKEIYLKNRREKEWETGEDKVCSGSDNLTKKANLQKK